MKRVRRALSAVLIAGLLTLQAVLCTACGSKPTVEELYDRVVELVEASYEVNTVLFGAGIPVYDKNDEGTRLMRVYSGQEEYLAYEYAREESNFYFAESIRDAAEKVYSKDYLKNVYASIFDGIRTTTGVTLYARYMESAERNGALSQSLAAEGLSLTPRIYRYSTMRVESGSRSDYALVTMETYLPGSGTPEITSVTLSLVKQNGAWYLNAPTY